MKVSDVMRKSVISIPQNGVLRDVIRLFVENHVDVLPVVDAAQRIAGLITIDSLIYAFLPRYFELIRDFGALQDKGQLSTVLDASFTGLDSSDEKLILAADLMKPKIRSVYNDESLLQAAFQLQLQGMQRLPVVDRDHKLVGLISDFDVVLALLQGRVPAVSGVAVKRNPN